jgi:hypothetical protein
MGIVCVNKGINVINGIIKGIAVNIAQLKE